MFYTISQNNVRGFNIKNEVVGDYLIVEADSLDEAENRILDITLNNDDYCECCGSRWDGEIHNKEGTISPHIYDTELDDYTLLNSKSIRIHLKDGIIIKYY